MYMPAVVDDVPLLLIMLPLQRGHDVWGCYMSPVADAYGKKGLAPVSHRLQMCSLAAAGTDNIMVDTWEATRPGYTRTLEVGRSGHRAYLGHIQAAWEGMAACNSHTLWWQWCVTNRNLVQAKIIKDRHAGGMNMCDGGLCRYLQLA